MQSHYAIKLEFDPNDYETIVNELYDLGMTSFEEGSSALDEDGNLYIDKEFSLITIRAENQEELSKIQQRLSNKFENIQYTDLGIQQSYLDEWKKFAEVIQITSTIKICPSWISEQADHNILILDPAYAFGSGSHETTQLCAELIEKLDCRDSLLDVGCGSGILSLVASLRGFKKIKAIDIDPHAVASGIENAKRNKIENIEFSSQGIGKINETYDVVVANIISGVLLDIKNDIKKVLKSNGVLIISGILCSEVEEVTKKFGYSNFKTTSKGEWAAVIFYV